MPNLRIRTLAGLVHRTRTMAQIRIPAATHICEEEYCLSGGIKIIDRWFETPLDYTDPSKTIRVFARNAAPNKKSDDGKSGEALPYFLYLQGGPGFECGPAENHPLTKFLFGKGFQVIYLDQRGTGMSTPISPRMLARDLLTGRKRSEREQAEYVKLFRADNIVRDCEAIRLSLLGDKGDGTDRQWSVVGQSFGGFCAVTYLSLYPEGLREVFTTGGMPPLVNNPDKVYAALYEKVKSRNEVYYQKYPRDESRVRAILQHLGANEVRVPNGGHLTPRRFLALGLAFGAHGGIDRVHYLVQRAFSDLDTLGHLSYKVLKSIESGQSFDGNILYALAQEAIYCQGEPSNWSASRTGTAPSSSADPPEDSLQRTVHFTGQMIYPWMFTDFAELSKLENVASILAEESDWPKLYDERALARNSVPVYAATYIEDMYVDVDLARRTAKKIKGAKEFVTNAFLHNAVRVKTDAVMGELWRLRSGEED